MSPGHGHIKAKYISWIATTAEIISHFGSDIMHLVALNIPDLLIILWCGTLDCDKKDDRAICMGLGNALRWRMKRARKASYCGHTIFARFFQSSPTKQKCLQKLMKRFLNLPANLKFSIISVEQSVFTLCDLVSIRDASYTRSHMNRPLYLFVTMDYGTNYWQFRMRNSSALQSLCKPFSTGNSTISSQCPRGTNTLFGKHKILVTALCSFVPEIMFTAVLILSTRSHFQDI